MAESARMASAASPVWTLSQASAWVVFRDHSVVDLFTPPQAESWVAYMMYPSHWTVALIGEELEIFEALRNGRLAATGRRPTPDALREVILQHEWHDLIPDVFAPYRRLANGSKAVPWLDILVLRADLERKWRGWSEVEGRSKFDKGYFSKLFLEQRVRDPELSANAIIDKVSQAFEEANKRDAPSLSTFKRYIKGL